MNQVADLLRAVHEAEQERKRRMKEAGGYDVPVRREQWKRIVEITKGVAMTVAWNLPEEEHGK
jgi:hypothetical protein